MPSQIYPNARTIENWIVEHLAQRLNVESGDIDVRQPFSALGLDSLDGVELAHQLETWLGATTLTPTLVWDYPSVDKLSRYLAGIARGDSSGR